MPVEFAVIDIKVKALSQSILQRHYVYVTKGYALIFVATYFSDADLKKINEIVRPVKIRRDLRWILRPNAATGQR